ncbi:MAG: PEGA domain-containing protein [Polyangiaceae bacterium]|nr:PEGA domain-containing protein [Polyangiaceae bacterium]
MLALGCGASVLVQPALAQSAPAQPALARDASLLEIAEARLAAGDGPGAVEALERLLIDTPEGAEADALRERVASIKATPATLELVSAPEAAEVRVDGERVGTTPLSVEVTPGAHAIALSLDGHAPLTDRVVVAFATRRTLAFELIPAPAEATVAEAEPGPLEPLEPLERERTATPAIWTLSSISAAALLTGTVLGFKALDEESDFVLEPTERGADRGERYALAADLSFGVAAGTAITALVLWLTRDEGEESAGDTARVRFIGSQAGVGFGAAVEF